MTRLAFNARKIAMLAACGSFVLFAAPAIQAQSSDAKALEASLNSLYIAPLRFELTNDQASATLTLTNTSKKPMPVQTRVFGWTQADGEDQYAPSTELAVSPSIVSIPAGQTQIVRLIRRTPAGQQEKRFRLAVDQLPDPDAESSGGAEALLRFTLPVFTDRDAAQPARLDWQLLGDRIDLVNSGGQTSQVTGLKVATLDGREIEVERNSMRYIQGSSKISWPIAGGCGLGRVKITAKLDGQTVDVEPAYHCS